MEPCQSESEGDKSDPEYVGCVGLEREGKGKGKVKKEVGRSLRRNSSSAASKVREHGSQKEDSREVPSPRRPGRIEDITNGQAEER